MTLPPDDPLRKLDPELQPAVRWACARAREWHHRFCPHHLCLQEWEQDALQIAAIAVRQASQQYREGGPLSRKAFCAICAERALWKKWSKECEWAKHTQTNKVYDEENDEWTMQEMEDMGGGIRQVGLTLFGFSAGKDFLSRDQEVNVIQIIAFGWVHSVVPLDKIGWNVL